MDSVVNQLHHEIQKCISSYQYDGALFYSEVLFSTMRNHPKDQYIYADTLFKLRQFRRAVDYINTNNLHNIYLNFRILYGRCLFAIKEPVDALDILDLEHDFKGIDKFEVEIFGKSENELYAEVYYLLGQIHESIENIETATCLYKKCVKYDMKCVCAIMRLYEMHCLSDEESKQFISNELKWQLNNQDENMITTFLKSIYLDMFSSQKEVISAEPLNDIKVEETKEECDIIMDGDDGGSKSTIIIKKIQEPIKLMENPREPMKMIDNPRVRNINAATRYFNNTQFRKCYDILERMINDDHYDPDIMVLYASVLKELDKKNDLYIYAYELIEKFPFKKEAWYALGSYNFLIGKLEQAIRCFNKASTIDRDFGYAWLALGHVLSAKNQRDQALRAYVSAAHLIRGSHKPDLYIAIEYSLSRNVDLCYKFLQKAAQNGGLSDPYYWHEKGYIHFTNREYVIALDCFSKAEELRSSQCQITRFWETLLANKGYCYYKLLKLEEARECFERVLVYSPFNRNTIVMLAMIKARQGNPAEALSDIQLAINRYADDGFLSSLSTTLVHIHSKYFNQSILTEFNSSGEYKPKNVDDKIRREAVLLTNELVTESNKTKNSGNKGSGSRRSRRKSDQKPTKEDMDIS